jgi:plasmid segregation protein ParM
MAAEHLQRLIEKDGIQRDLVDAEKALRDGFIRHFGQRIPLEEKIMEAQSVVSSKVSDMAAQLMSHYVQSIDGVIVTGGGASLVFDTLKARWPHTQLVNDRHQDGKPAAQLSGSRFVVSEGFYRYGRSLNLIRNMTNKAA